MMAAQNDCILQFWHCSGDIVKRYGANGRPEAITRAEAHRLLGYYCRETITSAGKDPDWHLHCRALSIQLSKALNLQASHSGQPIKAGELQLQGI